VRERCLGVQPLGVVPERGQELAGDFGADAGQCDQARSGRGHQRAEFDVSFADLLAEVLVATGKTAQRGLGGGLGVGNVAGRAQVAISTVVVRERSCSRSSAGAVTSSALSWLVVWLRALTALPRATRSARIASTRPSRPLGVPVAVPASAARAAE